MPFAASTSSRAVYSQRDGKETCQRSSIPVYCNLLHQLSNVGLVNFLDGLEIAIENLKDQREHDTLRELDRDGPTLSA